MHAIHAPQLSVRPIHVHFFPLSAVPSHFLRLVLVTEAGVSAFPQHMYADFLQLLP